MSCPKSKFHLNMVNEEDRGPLCAFLCCSLIGIGLLIGGAVWLSLLPEDECPCNSVQCCSMDESCPPDAPCLCLSVQTESSNSSCLPYKKRSGSEETGAESMLFLGVFLSSILAFIVIVIGLRVLFGLCTGVVVTLHSILDVFYGTVKKLGDGLKTLCLKLSKLWVRKRVRPVEDTEASAVGIPAAETELQ